MTLAKFKVRWVNEEARREAVQTVLATECHALLSNAEVGVRAQIPSTSYSTAYFFALDEEEEDIASFNSDREVIECLMSELEVLNHFSKINNIFMTFNTATPSNALVGVQLRQSCAYSKKKSFIRLTI